MKQKMLVAGLLLVVVAAGCSKNEPSDEAVAQKRDEAGRVAYVSDQEQYVQALQQEVEIADADALLDDLNESAGDNSHNAELVRLKSVEASPVPDAETTVALPTDAPTVVE